MASCEHCRNGWLGNRYGEDVECVNGVLIDIDVFYEGWPRDACYPPAPCQACEKCRGTGERGRGECRACKGTGWKSGTDESRERLQERASPDEEPAPDRPQEQEGGEAVNAGQIELARHALGLPNRRRQTYRNHFVTGEGAEDHARWTEMAASGWAVRRKGGPLTGGDDLFMLTRTGAQLALRRGERLDPKDFPTPPRAEREG